MSDEVDEGVEFRRPTRIGIGTEQRGVEERGGRTVNGSCENVDREAAELEPRSGLVTGLNGMWRAGYAAVKVMRNSDRLPTA